MNDFSMKHRRLWTPALALAMTVAVGCVTETGNSDDDTPTLENASDYPETGVSEACGGKCDNPDAALYSSSGRLLGNLDLIEQTRANEDPTAHILSAEPVDEEYDNVEDGHTLTVKLYALGGEQCAEDTVCAAGEACVNGLCAPADEEPQTVDAQLTYYVEGVGGYLTEEVDLSPLGDWAVLRADVSGTYGDQEIDQRFEFAPGLDQGVEVLPEPEDPFAPALDVNAGAIFIDPSVPAPDYERASVDNFGLGGTEFWQRWPGGASPTFSYSEGTELGRKCMYASARRFQAIMENPPESIVELKENSNWSGRFFNWNDDYSHEDASGSPRGAVLWAWRTGLVKWISQTGADGTCYLPTLGMVERAASNCLAEAERSDGEIEGCQAY